MEPNKIELRQDRDFGQVFNATFAFIKQEFKPLGASVLVFIVPFALLLGICLIWFQSSILADVTGQEPQFGASKGVLPSNFIKLYLLFMGFFVLSQTMIITTIYSYLNLYLSKVEKISISEMFWEVKYNFLPVFGALFISFVLILIGLVCCLLPGIYLAISLSFFIPAMIFEQSRFGQAFSRSFQLAHYRWWWTFLLALTSIIMIYALNFLIQSPLLLWGYSGTLFNLNSYKSISTGQAIYSAIATALSQLLYIIPAFLIGFQHFSIVEAKEQTLLNEKINQIGENA
jgi:hypothetical protein